MTGTPRTRGRSNRSTAASRLLDVSALGNEYGPNRFFWRDVIAKGLIPTIRPPQFRRVFVERADVEKLIASWKVSGQTGFTGRPEQRIVDGTSTVR